VIGHHAAAVAAQAVAKSIHSFLAVQGDEQFQVGIRSFQVGETGAGSQDGVLWQHRPRERAHRLSPPEVHKVNWNAYPGGDEECRSTDHLRSGHFEEIDGRSHVPVRYHRFGVLYQLHSLGQRAGGELGGRGCGVCEEDAVSHEALGERRIQFVPDIDGEQET